jgi:hypothetical protein
MRLPDQLSLAGAVVVQDQVHVQLRRHVLLDAVEEVAELPGTVPLLDLADDLAGLRVECGEPAGGAVALLVVGAARALLRHGRLCLSSLCDQ